MDYIAIVTLQNADGSYDEVGMSTRAIIGPYKRVQTINRYAIGYKQSNNHGRARVQLFNGKSVQGEPNHTYTI